MKLRTAIDILEDLKEREENWLCAMLLLKEKSGSGPYNYESKRLYNKLSKRHLKAQKLRILWEQGMDL